MPHDFKKYFSDPSIKIVFATAPTGLGHIRVTEALKDALGANIQTETIGIMNPTSQFLHRITSRNLFLRYVMELFQTNTILETGYSWIYKNKLRHGNRSVRKYLENIVRMDSRGTEITKLLIIATHFGLAHQIASIKNRLARETGLEVILVVVVTDDSPQQMWAVSNANYTFVPSEKTAQRLEKWTDTNIVVCPYPISLADETVLSKDELENRKSQIRYETNEKLSVLIPVSGAAVQLSFFKNVITELLFATNANVTVVSRLSPYTREFLAWCKRQKNIIVHESASDHGVVALYEKVIASTIFALEITKPSEQAFKALLSPTMRGGMLLMFSGAVGRQEFDNLSFLQRHGLLPVKRDERLLGKVLDGNASLEVRRDVLEKAKKWRGIILPRDGISASHMIVQLQKEGILDAMMVFSGFEKSSELSPSGAELFWKKLSAILSDRKAN